MNRRSLLIDGDAANLEQRERAGIGRIVTGRVFLAVSVAVSVGVGVGIRLGAGKNRELFPLPTVVQPVKIEILLAGEYLDKAIKLRLIATLAHGQASHARLGIF